MNAVDAGLPRRRIYVLLITVAAAAVAGRILAVTRLYEPRLHRAPDSTDMSKGPWPNPRPKPMPTIGANDRSRWATIRALVDDGTYAIGHRDASHVTEKNPYGDYGNITEEGWATIDKVLKPGTGDFYSSKPPFLPTLLAGEYWLLKQTFGWSITDDDGYVVRTILMTVNWLPFVCFLVVLGRMADQLGASDWGRLYVLAAGCFATYLTTFAITLNNHSVAAWSALFALYFAFRHWSAPAAPKLGLVLAGFFAGFTSCNELPAASLAAALFAVLLLRWPGPTLVCFLPAALLPVAGFLVTNYLAIGQWTPAYSEFGGPWYNFEGSHWQEPPPGPNPGIDWARLKETKAEYALHLLVGHHGLFSLSPIFLLALVGGGMALVRNGRTGLRPARFWLATLTLVLTVVVVGFYIYKSDNYGGWTSGPRWLMWLTPLFLLTMMPCVEWLAERRWGRGLAYLLLGLSVLSVSYPAWNPWRHPWIYDFLESQGVLPY